MMATRRSTACTFTIFANWPIPLALLAAACWMAMASAPELLLTACRAQEREPEVFYEESPSPASVSPDVAPTPTARSVLEVYGFLMDDWRQFTDGSPLQAERLALWPKLLQRLGRCDPAELAQLAGARPPARWFEGEWQGTVWQLGGRVVNCQRWPLDSLSATRFGFPEFYALELVLDESEGQHATVLTAHVPASWLREPSGEWDEPVKLVGVLVHGDPSDSNADGEPAPVFVTQVLEWYPARVQPDRGVSANMVWLAGRGMDIAAWQRTSAHGGLTHEDSQPFHQLLSAVRGGLTSGSPTGESPTALKDWDIVAWLKQPAEQRGELYEVMGTARRAIAIEVTDAALRDRHGVSRYYEIEVFVPLPRPLRLVPPRADGNGGENAAGTRTESNDAKSWSTYPVVFCCTELPQGFPLGETIHQGVRVTGFYYKLWSYRSRSGLGASGASGRGRESSPLLVGHAPVMATLPPLDSGWSTPLVLILFGLLLAVVGLLPWIWSRADRAMARKIRQLRSGQG